MFPVVDRTIASEQLRTLGLAFMNCADAQGAPKRIEDLQPYYENNRKITDAINNGTYVVFFGVNPTRMPGNTILAYQKEPDSKGQRVVLLCNASVEVMDADTFAAAPKAQPGR
jgi:hypothetical protein